MYEKGEDQLQWGDVRIFRLLAVYQAVILESASILFFTLRLIQSSKVEYVLVSSIFSVLKTLKLTGEKLIYYFIDLSIIIGYLD